MICEKNYASDIVHIDDSLSMSLLYIALWLFLASSILIFFCAWVYCIGFMSCQFPCIMSKKFEKSYFVPCVIDYALFVFSSRDFCQCLLFPSPNMCYYLLLYWSFLQRKCDFFYASTAYNMYACYLSWFVIRPFDILFYCVHITSNLLVECTTIILVYI